MHRCDDLQIFGYELDEVVLPAARRQEARTVVRIVITGRGLRHRAVPLFASVGGVAVEQLRLDEASQTLEGVLLEEPERGGRVRVSYADMDADEHPDAYDPGQVTRIG